ncbi:MAG: molybdopterin synthase catalytic subunit MoaE [Gammaproteobacteria bacterium]|nr:molybdopterin synthase catalytic subunit MoaE [Gammaproteobacteria bacterium]HCL72551.1 molybdopterin synthase catalytic subunit MoaE [Gammaproteobacteria bacterium]
MITVQQADFDLAAEYKRLREDAGDAGAIVTFTGLVREFYMPDADEALTGGSTQTLYLEHYPGMTEKSLQDIVAQAESRWPLLGTRIIHRIGKLQPGDQIVIVATASSHRHAAFEAAEFIMDYLKSHAPFWKKQSSATSSDWISSRSSDSEALKRWQD